MKKNKILLSFISKGKKYWSDFVYHFSKYIFYFIPIKKDKIVFDSFCGKGYGCNPKYIAEEIIRQRYFCDMVWIVKNKDEIMPSEIRKVKYGSMRSYYEYATAKIWIDNVKSNRKPRKKKRQFYIQTWHSSLGLKKVEADAKSLEKWYVNSAKKDARMTDLMFANNTFRNNQYRNSFWYSGEIIRCGVPRNSILFNDKKVITQKVKLALSIEDKKHLILYAPTFRAKNDNNDVYKFDYEKIISAFQNKYGHDYALMVRLHPNISITSEALEFSSSVINASYYPDIQELIAASDVIITDYSSCMFDAAFAKKIVFIYAQDLEEYINDDQGLLMDYYSLPFQIAKNTKELEKNIYDFSNPEYEKNCTVFFESIGLQEDGHGDQKVVEIIKNVINK